MTRSQALCKLRPGASWIMRDDVIEWLDSSQTQPTEDEIIACLAAFDYQAKRAKEYPAITDQLDAVMKGGQALTDMQSLCMAVKAKYPKPQ